MVSVYASQTISPHAANTPNMMLALEHTNGVAQKQALHLPHLLVGVYASQPISPTAASTPITIPIEATGF